jgi:DNA-binding protein Fis
MEDLYDEVISRVERPLIELVLERTGNNQLKAAEILGLNRNTLRKKIAERNVVVPEATKK